MLENNELVKSLNQAKSSSEEIAKSLTEAHNLQTAIDKVRHLKTNKSILVHACVDCIMDDLLCFNAPIQDPSRAYLRMILGESVYYIQHLNT